jgi:hypothetical protein
MSRQALGPGGPTPYGVIMQSTSHLRLAGRTMVIVVSAVALVIAMAGTSHAFEGGVLGASSGANWVRIIGVVGLIGARLVYGAGLLSSKRRRQGEIHATDAIESDDADGSDDAGSI